MRLNVMLMVNGRTELDVPSNYTIRDVLVKICDHPEYFVLIDKGRVLKNE